MREEKNIELLKRPFCVGGTTQIHKNGRVWTGMKYGDPTSVSVQHWCDKVEGQPNRMIERIGRDEISAIDAWNRRAGTVSTMAPNVSAPPPDAAIDAAIKKVG